MHHGVLLYKSYFPVRLNKLYMDIKILNLDLNVVDSDLRKLFAPYGIVNSAEVVRDKFNGRSKGSGMINMPVEKEARQAIESLDKSMLLGKKVSVNEYRADPQW
jgi:RNA recognition motif-containing protein